MSRGKSRTALPRHPVTGLGDPDLILLYESLYYHGGLSADPAEPREGELWLRTDLDPVELRGWVGGVAVTLPAGSGTAGPVAWSDITGTPTTLAGYGITDDVILEGDTRLTDARTPTLHASTHESGGSDPLDMDSIAGMLDASKLYGTATLAGLAVTDSEASFNAGALVAGLRSFGSMEFVGLSFGEAPLGNIPSFSGLNVNFDADELDGQHGSYYLDRANHTGTTPLSTLEFGSNNDVLRTVGGAPSWGLIANANVDAAAAIAWTKISKTGSSLADLTTRSAGDLTSGNLAYARLPGTTAGAWNSSGVSLGGSSQNLGGSVRALTIYRNSSSIPTLQLAYDSDAIPSDTQVGTVSQWAGSATPREIARIGFINVDSGEDDGHMTFWTMLAGTLSEQMRITNQGNLSLFGTGSYGGGVKVAFLGNAGTVPTTNPASGGVLYAQGGAGKWRGPSGTVTTFGTAEPHCPVCDTDYMLEWENAAYGYLAFCIHCLANELGPRPYILTTKTA
jgi:hypothetical protein